MRAAIGKVVEGEPSAAALEQALRDEDAEPHMVRHTGAGRKVGLAKAPEKVERKSRSVIADLDRDGRRVPESGDVDREAGSAPLRQRLPRAGTPAAAPAPWSK